MVVPDVVLMEYGLRAIITPAEFTADQTIVAAPSKETAEQLSSVVLLSSAPRLVGRVKIVTSGTGI